MYEIVVKYPLSIVEDIIENLHINDIYNIYYNSPISVTTYEYGYDYEEVSDELVDLTVVVDSDTRNYVDQQANLISSILKIDISKLSIKKSESIVYEPLIDVIDLDNGWIIADPDYSDDSKNKIKFKHKGAFGSGLHETTQDCLKYILEEDFSGKTVLDIGTGSGILSIASSIKNALKVTALDIRDVRDEIEFNSDLNDVNNIDVIIGDIIHDDIVVDDNYDYVFINIGGEETQEMMDFINSKTKPNTKLLVSGLVEWSFDKVLSFIESYGYTSTKVYKTNEWCTVCLVKNLI